MLISGDYTINITKNGKYTIAEVIIDFNNYKHHYFGLAIKHPLDQGSNVGEIIAIKKALRDIILKEVIDITENFIYHTNKVTKKEKYG